MHTEVNHGVFQEKQTFSYSTFEVLLEFLKVVHTMFFPVYYVFIYFFKFSSIGYILMRGLFCPIPPRSSSYLISISIFCPSYFSSLGYKHWAVLSFAPKVEHVPLEPCRLELRIGPALPGSVRSWKFRPWMDLCKTLEDREENALPPSHSLGCPEDCRTCFQYYVGGSQLPSAWHLLLHNPAL